MTKPKTLEQLTDILEAYCVARNEGFLLRMIRGNLTIIDYLKKISEINVSSIIEQEAEVKALEVELTNEKDNDRVERKKERLIRAQKRLKESKDDKDFLDKFLLERQRLIEVKQ